MKLKNICICLSATILLLLMNVMQLKADEPDLPCGDPDIDPGCAPPLDAPIDAMVILLALAILFLAAKKITEANRIEKLPVKEA